MQAGGLEGRRPSENLFFLAVGGGEAAPDRQKRMFVGKVAPSPRPFA